MTVRRFLRSGTVEIRQRGEFLGEALIVLTILSCFTSAHARSYAKSNEMSECRVAQVTTVNEEGFQTPQSSYFATTNLTGALFLVNRRTGVITGKDISTEGYDHKVLADGRTLKNPFTVISTAGGSKDDGVNASYFLVINTHVSGARKTFLLKSMNGELLTGTCN